jgi:hypothetical protein
LNKIVVFVLDEIVDAKVFTCSPFLERLLHTDVRGSAGRPEPFPNYIEASDWVCTVWRE